MRRDYEGDTESMIGADVRRILEEERQARMSPRPSFLPDEGPGAPDEGAAGQSSGYAPYETGSAYNYANREAGSGMPGEGAAGQPSGYAPYETGSAYNYANREAGPGRAGSDSHPGQPPREDNQQGKGVTPGGADAAGPAGKADSMRRPMTRAEARALKEERRAAEKEARERAKRIAAEEKAAVKAARREARREKAPYVFISWFFVMIFLSLIVYLVYFNLYRRDAVLDSPYNRRSDIQVRHTVRGSIVSSEGDLLAGTELDEEGNETRIYPYGSVFAHAVGYATNGRSGLESIANYELLTSHINLIDRMANELRDTKSPGDSVVTTISSTLQQAAWEALGDRQGAVVAIDPQTGAIRALVSKPDFDPNTIAADWKDIISGEGNSQLVNRVTQGLYAPGSTFKIATALAYYREKGSLDGFHYDCTGELTVGEHTVHCYEGTAHGEENLAAAFARSCNCAFSAIGLEIGADRLSETTGDLLFGQVLPCELSYKRSRYSLTAGDGSAAMMQTAFGQGNTLVTPYHMALIVSAIANDGILMKPQLIWKVESADGKPVYENDPESFGSLMSGDEAAMLTGLMEQVVAEGTGSGLSDLDYPVAGKTGSAEFTRSDGSVGTHAWFVGFSNISDPDLVVAVLIEDGGSGSGAALPVAREVFEVYQEVHRG